jgi:uncharacterized protein (DUF2252 family)
MDSIDDDEAADESKPIPAGMRYEHGKVVPHLTIAERLARGKAARAEVPRSSHADFAPSASRPDPVALLESQAVTRVPELVPIRYGRMLVSPFTFYRGAALIMASDLSHTPRSGLMTQLCGDAHLMNFGVFGSPDRRLVFDMNDFDETLPGPWEWDVKRLAASFAIAGRDNGYPAKDRKKVLLSVADGYRTAMREFAAMPNMDVWYSRFDTATLLEEMKTQLDARTLKRSQAAMAKARTRDSMQALDKLTHVVDGERRIVSDVPLIQPVEEFGGEQEPEMLMDWLRAAARRYRSTLQSDRRHLLEEFRLVHAARKVVGVGSVGTRAWILLMEGRDDADPLFLQAKEAQPSVLEDFLGRSRHSSNGERVVHGQHLMAAASDIFLGWLTFEGTDGESRDFYVRQLRDWKGSAVIESQTPPTMAYYGRICGATLARAHARSGDRIAIASYLGANDVFDRALAEFSEAYADQNERDYDALVAAEKSGRITAQRGL